MFALVRDISEDISHCELTHLDRVPIDLGLARAQHEGYVGALKGLGCTILALESGPEMPDGVFVEDAALVLDELGIITRPGAGSRRTELDSVAAALGQHMELARIEPPGTLDGGDILRIGRRLFVGGSSRSNLAGREQLADIAGRLGYTMQTVDLVDCLHLKSACSVIDRDTILANQHWVDPTVFDVPEVIHVPEEEPFAANILAIEGRLLVSAEAPGTISLLESRGHEVVPVANSELAKAEGGLTCCSIIWK